MTFEIAVVGAPFLDLTFEGLERLPSVGEEVVARTLHVAAGGTGMQAIGASRLGLSAAIVAPIGNSGTAGLIAKMLEAEGVTIVSDQKRSAAIPVTALLTTTRGVAMASVVDAVEPTADEVSSAGACAVLLSLGRLGLAPPGVSLYAVTGSLELGGVTKETVRRLSSTHAFIVNAAEAAALTGLPQPDRAALDLACNVPTAIVTLGADGALAAEGRRVSMVPAPEVDVVDATGAGDLFAAAYVWAELRGAELEDRLAWASLYAGLSTRAATAMAGAVAIDQLLAEGTARGLSAPPLLNVR